jgi:hypothetical protein
MDCELLLVSALGDAQGARGAAAALACAASTADRAALLVDLGARQPRPTLLSSSAASALEDTLAATLPGHPPAARGQLCHLALPPDRQGLGIAAFAGTRLPDRTLILHLPHELLPAALQDDVLRPDGVLLRADMQRDRQLAARTVRQLVRAGLPVSILRHRLNWLAERRALFGTLPSDAPGGLPPEIVNRLLRRSEG